MCLAALSRPLPVLFGVLKQRQSRTSVVKAEAKEATCFVVESNVPTGVATNAALLGRARGYGTATIASTMIGTFSGDGPCPGADLACRPASPHSSTIRSLNPFTTLAF